MSADEFLVKRSMTTSEFDKIPEPGTLNENKKVLSEEEKIKKILKAGETKNKNNKSYGTTEKAILEKIRK